MIYVGLPLLLIGLIGFVTAIVDRKTTGWNTTRLKFVVTSVAVTAVGLTILAVYFLKRI